MNKEIIKTLFPEAVERIEKGVCTVCEYPINVETDFEDNDLGMREYIISGLCKLCQAKTYE